MSVEKQGNRPKPVRLLTSVPDIYLPDYKGNFRSNLAEYEDIIYEDQAVTVSRQNLREKSGKCYSVYDSETGLLNYYGLYEWSKGNQNIFKAGLYHYVIIPDPDIEPGVVFPGIASVTITTVYHYNKSNKWEQLEEIGVLPINTLAELVKLEETGYEELLMGGFALVKKIPAKPINEKGETVRKMVDEQFARFLEFDNFRDQLEY